LYNDGQNGSKWSKVVKHGFPTVKTALIQLQKSHFFNCTLDTIALQFTAQEQEKNHTKSQFLKPSFFFFRVLPTSESSHLQ